MLLLQVALLAPPGEAAPGRKGTRGGGTTTPASALEEVSLFRAGGGRKSRGLSLLGYSFIPRGQSKEGEMRILLWGGKEAGGAQMITKRKKGSAGGGPRRISAIGATGAKPPPQDWRFQFGRRRLLGVESSATAESSAWLQKTPKVPRGQTATPPPPPARRS